MFFTLFFVSFAASANNSQLATKIYDFCRSNGGKVAYEPTASVDPATGQVCVKSACAIDSREGDQSCDINIDSQTIPSGCARAVLQTCGSVVSSGGAQSGASAGSSAGVSSGASAGVSSGSSAGASSGVQSGSGSGSGSGDGSGNITIGRGGKDEGGAGGGGFYSEDLGGYMYDDHPCYNKCKKTWGFFGIFSKEGAERKECRQCLGIRSSDDAVYVRGASVGSARGGSAGGVYVAGGAVGGGRAGGAVGGAVGAAVGGAAGSVHIVGGAAGGGGDWATVVVDGITYRIPAHCVNGDGSVKSSCRGYLTVEYRVGGGGAGRCEYSSDMRGCVGDDDYTRIVTRHQTGVDCVNCAAGSRGGQHWLSGVAEIVGAIAPPLAQFGVAYMGYKGQKATAEAWAGAARAGFEQCRLSQQDYLAYLQTNELPGMTPEQQAAMRCNGYSLGGFAGLGGQFGNGFGGFGNPLIGGGYSPGFIGGMIGPYGGYNPYGGGGGFVGGAIGGYAGGVPGGFPVGGAVGGLYVVAGAAGGLAGGYAGGYPGGYAGGYPGGYAGGFNAGAVGGAIGGVGLAGGFNAGAVGGFQGGYPGGFAGGFNAGAVGGAIGGIGLAGGFNAGAVGGFQGGYPGGFAGGFNAGAVGGIGIAGGFQGGFQGGYPGGFNAGAVGGIGLAGGFQGGFPGGYPGIPGQGGWGSGTLPYPGGNGGYWGATGGYGVQQSYFQNQQASNQDALFQQQGLATQFGQAANNSQMYSGGYGYGYNGFGSAGMAPGNIGAGLYAGVGINF